MSAETKSRPRVSRFGCLMTVGAAIVGATAAWRMRWLCDDAFISFRYADNLVNGLGLVFNAGERVEGYTNFLWTLWLALGMKLGFAPEDWAIASGIACYVATIVLLAWRAVRTTSGATITSAVPWAAVWAALHADWWVYATSGLETSAVTLLVTAGWGCASAGRSFCAGALLALAILTRPDAVVVAAVCLLWLAVVDRRGWRAVVGYVAPLALLVGAHLVWRHAYYGDWLPNTYYAKSADRAWWSQGAVYVGLYAVRYWVVLLGLSLLLRFRPSWRDSVWLALACGVAYAAAIARVGGDFMFARMLVPATPLLLLAAERGLREAVGSDSRRARWLPAVFLAGLVATPSPLRGQNWIRGIVNERAFYTPERRELTRRQADTLRRFFDGLPVRVAFLGAEARLVYYARPQVAIECQTGLTDRFIAHQPLVRRGRVGHEKRAPADYVVIERDAHLVFHPHASQILRLNRVIPYVEIDLDGVRGRVLNWDPSLLSELARRGAEVPDIGRLLDEALAARDERTTAEWRELRRRWRIFYFRHVPDDPREALFEDRAKRAGTVDE